MNGQSDQARRPRGSWAAREWRMILAGVVSPPIASFSVVLVWIGYELLAMPAAEWTAPSPSDALAFVGGLAFIAGIGSMIAALFAWPAAAALITVSALNGWRNWTSWAIAGAIAGGGVNVVMSLLDGGWTNVGVSDLLLFPLAGVITALVMRWIAGPGEKGRGDAHGRA